MSDQFTNEKTEALEKFLAGNRNLVNFTFKDSTVADTVIQTTAKALFESGRFDVVVPKMRNILNTSNSLMINPLDSLFVRDICRDFNVDAVLVLEYFQERFNSKLHSLIPITIKQSDKVSEEEKIHSGTFAIQYNAEWRLYYPHPGWSADKFQKTDRLLWRGWSYIPDDLHLQLPKVKSALIEGGIAAGYIMADEISPKWLNHPRNYFVTRKAKIDQAIPLIKKNKWEEATQIWTKYTTINSKRTRGKVEFNLALASEMNGDLDHALQWCQKSIETDDSQNKKVYLGVIKQRQKEVKREVGKKMVESL